MPTRPKRESKPRASDDTQVKPDKPDDDQEERRQPVDPSAHGIPPGVSFDTEAGRRAQGMDEDFDNKKRPAEIPPQDREPDPVEEDDAEGADYLNRRTFRVA